MNERIKEFEKQCWSHRVDGVLVDGHLHFDTQKFAELIVRECLNEIQSLLDCNTQVDEFEQGVYNGLDMAKDCIKEHFGVEE